MLRRRLPDLLIIALLFALPLLMFWNQTVGGRTLLPTENLYQYEPYATYREVVHAPAIPYNHLVSDLVLQNYQWKSFIRQQISAGEIPLWNPYQFSGIAFLAAGQHSALYPFSILYYVLDLPAAYGWFTVVQLWIAGIFMFAFARGLGISRAGSTVAGVTYQLAAFFVASAVFPMIIAAAAWLPLILLMIEYIIRHQPLFGRPTVLPWIAVGAVALGCNILAGHVEITYYTLLIAGYYAAARLLYMLWTLWRSGRGVGERTTQALSLQTTENSESRGIPGFTTGYILREVAGRGAALVALVVLGGALGAVQFMPLFEAASNNFRAGGVTYEQIKEWAHPARDAIQFVMPNFYGSPAHHTYFDVFDLRTVSLIDETVMNAAVSPQRITNTEWGMKNYVEGALYVGILPLILAAIALLDRWILNRRAGTPYRIILSLLVLASLTFMFGLPTYQALLFLPGVDQLHSPFRWVFPLTFCIAVLAGFGMDSLLHHAGRWSRRIGAGLVGVGGLILVGLVASRFLYAQVEPLVERVFTSLAKATDAFSGTRMFYSYQFVNVGIFALMLVASGVVILLVRKQGLDPHPVRPEVGTPSPVNGRGRDERSEPEEIEIPGKQRTRRASSLRRHGWELLAVGVIAADLLIATAHFNPASDPALLDFTPPSIQWLMGQPGEWRYTTIDEDGKPALFNANMTMRYGLQDIRGYESIIPASYVNYMERAYPQTQLEFNRISPIRLNTLNQVSWNRLSLLNVRYVITHNDTVLPATFAAEFPANEGSPSLVYRDEAVTIYEIPDSSHANTSVWNGRSDTNWVSIPADVTRVSSRELLINVSIPDWSDLSDLNISENWNTDWRAYIRPTGAPEAEEKPLLVFGDINLNIVTLHLQNDGDWTVRLVYSPASFQVGLFASFIGVVVSVLLVGAWGWSQMIGERDHVGAARLARNSIAPILLNLFNRGIDMAFALVMLRILGPTDAGWYFYAGVIFVWFDIFSNFGLNLYLTREVSRDRSKARLLFVNTSALRVLLAALGVPLLIAFFAVRQGIADPPLTPSVILAIGILYIGLLPNSLSTGFTALFYAFERAELPSAVATAATVNKVVLGVGVLLLGWGFVGLAAVSILTNILTLVILAYYGRGMVSAPSPTEKGSGDEVALSSSPPITKLIQPSLMRHMAGESAPLLFNHFLAVIFFQIDVVVIEALRGATMVGQYSVGYKWLNALNVIPSFFTQALLPRMSRLAHEDRAALRRDYMFGVKLMLSLSLPVAVFFTFTAYFWAGFLGGAEYLPDGAIATQLLIWSIPIGWMNSLTQYALIALDLHRKLTRAFAAGVIFNLVFNILLVPQYGYQAAAIVTILSEGVLFIGFALLMREGLQGMGIRWIDVVGRPLISAALMFLVMWIGYSSQPALALVAGCILYAGTLLALGTFDREEIARLLPLLPARLRARFA